ncbi:MAG: hypothetical protein RLZZ519_991 [Bacteroidota bacterium]|jgi:hypothetical protein
MHSKERTLEFSNKNLEIEPMKRLVPLFTLCLVSFFGSALFAQQAHLKVLANSKEVSGEVILDGTQRLTFIVTEADGQTPASAYEFGAIRLVPSSGAAIELRGATIENKNNTIYSLRTALLQAYPQGFTIQMDGVKAVHPYQMPSLSIPSSELKIKVLPKKN